MRLFVALELPAEARGALWAWSAGLDGAAWRRVPEANLHVTLAFLGERPEGDVPIVEELLRAPADPSALGLRCAGVVALPPRRPRVVAVALGGDARLSALQAELSRGLAAAGVHAPEHRRFLPHVTVGRARRGARPAAVAGLAPPECAFAAEAVTLFRSRPGPGGSVYEPLASVRLG